MIGRLLRVRVTLVLVLAVVLAAGTLTRPSRQPTVAPLEGVLKGLTRLIGDDAVTVQASPWGNEATRVTPPDGPGYALIAHTVRELMPEAVVAPAPMIAATDSRHFDGYAAEVFKLTPVRARPEDLGRCHGTHERIAVANLAERVRCHHRLVISAQEAS